MWPHMQNAFSTLKTLRAVPVHPPVTPATDLLVVPTVSPFPECHMAGPMQYGASSGWLLSLTSVQVKGSLGLFMA